MVDVTTQTTNAYFQRDFATQTIQPYFQNNVGTQTAMYVPLPHRLQSNVATDTNMSDVDEAFVSRCFTHYALREFDIHVPEDFVSLAAKAMAQLQQNSRTNVLYNLAKGWGTQRDDGSDSRFPTKRIPMGLVEHTANFFASEQMRKVRFMYIHVHVFHVLKMYIVV